MWRISVIWLATVGYGTAYAEPLNGGMQNSIEMKLVRIPAGKFVMGSKEGQDEMPLHEVSISKPFFLGETEVTCAEFEAVMGRTLDFQNNPSRAATRVGWRDAVAFCYRLTDIERRTGWLPPEGQVYRLPSEAEWEYACRAGKQARYCFGDDEKQLGDYAWIERNIPDFQKHAQEVRQKRPNAWGLYDMHGNVLEWCWDWYNPAFYGDSPDLDPQGPASGSLRMLRGGSWGGSHNVCRSAFRAASNPSRGNEFIGFRVVLTTK
jgi:formylglycine-generating enzyme required for sulfatase activity